MRSVAKVLVRRWAADCDSVDAVLELVSLDIVIKLMPRLVANHVKDSKPTTVGEAAKLADDFMRHRGWIYSQPEEGERNKRSWKKDKIPSQPVTQFYIHYLFHNVLLCL